MNCSTTIFLLFLILMTTTYGLCPTKCLCKWKGGKETVECVNASFTRVPHLDSTTQVLDLSLNNLIKLQEDTFRSGNLLNLQKIYLRRCSLHVILGRCFRGMHNLVELDLSFNLLQSIPEEALVDAQYLMVLALTDNPIRRISRNQLSPLKYLQTLDLSRCQIVEIDPESLTGLSNLLWLKLDNNLLKTIDPLDSLPSKVRGISLHLNRWNCDCNLVQLRNFLENRTVSLEVDPICHTPDRIKGQLIGELSDSDLACVPKVTPSFAFEEVISGKNISLVCRVESVPLSRVTWRYKGLLIHNGSTLVTDIDLRTYFYSNLASSGSSLTSELVIQRVTEDDRGEFECEAENRAGTRTGRFNVSVVSPVQPEPPRERKVEDPFKQEYFVVIGIAAIIISVLTIVITMFLIVKCRRGRSRSRTTDPGPLYQCSINDSSFSSDRSLMTVHAGKRSCDVTSDYSHVDKQSCDVTSVDYPPDIYKQLSPNKSHVHASEPVSYTQLTEPPAAPSILKKTFSLISISDSANDISHNTFNHIILPRTTEKSSQPPLQRSSQPQSSPRSHPPLERSSQPPPPPPRRDNPSDTGAEKEKGEMKEGVLQLLPPEGDEAQNIRNLDLLRPPENHWHFSTLPRKKLARLQDSAANKLSLNLQHFVPIEKGGAEVILPPPPQFKGVHFGPGLPEPDSIPQEGLPTLPAVYQENSY